MLWKWCHFQTHFLVLKYERWKLGLSRRVQMHFPVSCYCFSSPFLSFFRAHESDFRENEKNILSEGIFYARHFNVEEKRYLFRMYGTWDIFSLCHHEEKTRDDDMLSILPGARHESAFFLNEAFFFIFSRLLSQLFRQLLPFFSKTLPFVFAAF